MYQGVVNMKGQITIPAEIRAILGVNQGDKVEFSLKGSSICVELRPKMSLSSLRGVFAKKSKRKHSLAEMQDAIEQRSLDGY